MTKQVALRLFRMLEQDGKDWLLERGKLVWVRVVIARPISCGACGGTIGERKAADLLCVEFAFRKICLEVFCLFCSRQLKRKDALVHTINEVRLNGRDAM